MFTAQLDRLDLRQGWVEEDPKMVAKWSGRLGYLRRRASREESDRRDAYR